MQTTFFYLGRFLKKLVDDQCSFKTKGSIYHIKHIYIQPFTTVVDWLEIWCLIEVSTMFQICRYCVFTWVTRAAVCLHLHTLFKCWYWNEWHLVWAQTLQHTFLSGDLWPLLSSLALWQEFNSIKLMHTRVEATMLPLLLVTLHHGCIHFRIPRRMDTNYRKYFIPFGGLFMYVIVSFFFFVLQFLFCLLFVGI